MFYNLWGISAIEKDIGVGIIDRSRREELGGDQDQTQNIEEETAGTIETAEIIGIEETIDIENTKFMKGSRTTVAKINEAMEDVLDLVLPSVEITNK